MADVSKYLDGRKAICKACRKTFEIPFYVIDWGWRYGAGYCCSYHCMQALREAQRLREDQKPVRKPVRRPRSTNVRWVTREERVLAHALRSQGIGMREIGRRLGRPLTTIENILSKGVDYERKSYANQSV